MPELILGPMLRYVGDHDATVWVETDGPCEVEVLGTRERTFHVEGHHYALVLIEGLEPDTSTPYTVRLDGRDVWPPADGRPPCRIVTRGGEDRVRLVFGSCRVGAPHREPWTLPPREHREGFGIDALWAYSKRLQAGSEGWPDCVLLMGDQVYADEVPPDTKEFIRRAERDRRRGRPPPEVADFEEYTRLYRESWSRAGHPVAAVDGAERDDLRRPRGPRRLEHLGRLARATAAAAVVARADLRRLHGVLDLPAHRATSRRTTSATSPWRR